MCRTTSLAASNMRVRAENPTSKEGSRGAGLPRGTYPPLSGRKGGAGFLVRGECPRGNAMPREAPYPGKPRARSVPSMLAAPQRNRGERWGTCLRW